MNLNNLNETLSELANWLEENLNNNIEKIQILSKINELVFWIEMYQEKYMEQDNELIEDIRD